MFEEIQDTCIQEVRWVLVLTPLGVFGLAAYASAALRPQVPGFLIASFSIPGIPGGTIVGMIPVLMAAGLPVEGAGLLLAVDTIPDMFRTTANVTGDMMAAVVLGERERRL